MVNNFSANNLAEFSFEASTAPQERHAKEGSNACCHEHVNLLSTFVE